MESSNTRLRTTLYLGAMMLLVIGLSYFFFAGQSLRLDEAQSLWQSSRSPADILTIVSQDVHVPLYHEILHFWRLYVGDGVVLARMLSLLFYLACIPAMYFLGKLAYSRSVGLLGALLLSISPFMNWYGNEIRMYTLFTLLVILNQYCYIRILKSRRDEPLTWLAYGATALLGVFTHYFFFLNLLGQAIFYFVRPRLFPPGSLRRFLIVAGIVVVTFAPWAWFVLSQGQAGNSEPGLAVPSTVDLFSAFSQFLFGFQNDNINTVFLSLWPVTILVALLSLRQNKRIVPATEYLLLSVLFSVGIAFGISYAIPVFVSRYLIFTVPALYLLLVSLLGSFTPPVARASRAGLVALMLVMLGVEIMSPTTPVKEDYRGAVNFIEANATPQDIVLLSAPFTIYPVEYYYRGASPVATLPQWDQYSHGAIPPYSAAQLPGQVQSLTQNYQDVYLLLSYNQGYQGDIQNYFDGHYQQLLHKIFSPGLDLYVYRIRYDTGGSAISIATSSAFAE